MSKSIALKALNQYRKRDIIAYISLRYYLDSESSRTDFWAEEVAVSLTLNNPSSNFFKTKHFKGVVQNEVKFREIYIPSPNDIISESVLIGECSKYDSFQTNSSVYSYLFSDDNKSVYQQYINGLNKRFLSIQRACKSKENEEILYLDVKSFYPSIKLSSIQEVWLKSCEKSKIPSRYQRLGQSFIDKYKLEQKDIDTPGLLVGPMFSHLLANLYLKEVDKAMKDVTLNRYWRYVDDIVLVGTKVEIELFSKKLHELMGDLSLSFHSEAKSFKIKTKEWLENKNGMDSTLSQKWPKLIGLIKKLAMLQPAKVDELKQIFDQNEIRLEVLDLSRETKSESLSLKLYYWIKRNMSSSEVNVKSIVRYVSSIREDYLKFFNASISMKDSNELEYKSRITRLKYLVGRLIYLAKESDLKRIMKTISEVPELRLQYEIINSILTSDVSAIIKLGTNSTQAVAQVLKQKTLKVFCSIDPSDDDAIIALAIFKFHGIEIEFKESEEIKNSFFNFACGDIEGALNSGSAYIDEIASLHGKEESRHEQMLTTLFDENETLSFDVLNAGQQSGYSI